MRSHPRFATLVEAFWHYVPSRAPEACWLWEGPQRHTTRPSGGYGHLWFQGRTYAAHRASWMIHHGDIPEGIFVCHRCDIGPCVNPAHLFLGTARDNNHDMMRKQRHWHGEQHHRAKLTAAQVDDIRSLAATQTNTALAKQFGVNNATISDIVRGVIWRESLESPRMTHTGSRGARGEKQWLARLTTDDVRLMRQLRDQGMPLKTLAERFGVNFQNVSLICLRKTWKHVE